MITLSGTVPFKILSFFFRFRLPTPGCWSILRRLLQRGFVRDQQTVAKASVAPLLPGICCEKRWHIYDASRIRRIRTPPSSLPGSHVLIHQLVNLIRLHTVRFVIHSSEESVICVVCLLRLLLTPPQSYFNRSAYTSRRPSKGSRNLLHQ